MTNPLHIGLIAQGGRNWIGGLELTKNLTEAVTRYCRSASRDVQVTVFGIGEDSAKLVNFPSGENIEFADIPAVPPASLARRIANRYLFLDKLHVPQSNQQLAKECSERGVDFLYPIAELPESTSCRSAAWIPDLQHCRLPQFFTQQECEGRTAMFRSFADTAKKIVFSSRDAEKDFAEFHPEAKVETTVLPFRVIMPQETLDQPASAIVEKYHLPDRYFLVCGQFWAHKNHTLILDAIERLVAVKRNVLVVMTGRLSDYRNESHVDQVLAEIHTRGISQNVRILGLVPKPDQIQLIRGSLAVVQPSLFEGWSTVVEECHALGKRLILSDIPSHIEQAVPEALIFPRHSADSLANAMTDVWGSSVNESSMNEKNAAESYGRLVLKFGEQFCRLAERP